jgi:hypothetical protein
MRLTTEDVLKLFRDLEIELTEEADEAWGFVTVDGKRVLAVHCDRTPRELIPGLVRRLRKSLQLSAAEFEDLVHGALGRDDYLELLRDKGEPE